MKEYDKLKSLYDEIDILIEKRVRANSTDFITWKTRLGKFLINYYGQDSYEYVTFDKQKFSLLSFDSPEALFIEKCRQGLEVTKTILKEYLEELYQEKTSKFESVENFSTDKTQNTDHNKRIFIVHGHDGELRESVARVLGQQGIEPIILSERVNIGEVIIEKIERNSNVRAAVILFTRDDMCKSRNDESFTYRARQNVIFEAGYFIAKLGRNRVVIIIEDNLELPSDLSGMVYTAKGNWKIDVLRELRGMGVDIDFNKIF